MYSDYVDFLFSSLRRENKYSFSKCTHESFSLNESYILKGSGSSVFGYTGVRPNNLKRCTLQVTNGQKSKYYVLFSFPTMSLYVTQP